MKKLIEKISASLIDEDDRVFVRQVAWLDLEEKVREFYKFFDENQHKAFFGNFYISSNQEYSPYSKHRHINRLNSLNQIQISTGNKISMLYHSNKKGKIELIFERSACLWFSQDILGRVSVFLSPYTSQTYEVLEKYFIKNVHFPNSNNPNRYPVDWKNIS